MPFKSSLVCLQLIVFQFACLSAFGAANDINDPCSSALSKIQRPSYFQSNLGERTANFGDDFLGRPAFARRRRVDLPKVRGLARAASISRDGSVLVTVSLSDSDQENVNILNLRNRRTILSLPLGVERAYDVDASRDGRRTLLVIGRGEGQGRGSLALIDNRSRKVRRIDVNPYLLAAAFSPDGRTIAAMDASGRLLIFETEGLTLVRQVALGKPLAMMVRYSASGEHLVIAAKDEVLVLQAGDLALLACMRTHGLGRRRENSVVRFAELSPDGQHLLVLGRDGSNVLEPREILKIIDWKSGRTLHEVDEEGMGSKFLFAGFMPHMAQGRSLLMASNYNQGIKEYGYGDGEPFVFKRDYGLSGEGFQVCHLDSQGRGVFCVTSRGRSFILPLRPRFQIRRDLK